jgi:hypothetical protein
MPSIQISPELSQGDDQTGTSKSARRPWTADELKQLDDLTKAGKTAVEIAAILQRTPTSIYAKLQRLEIKRLRSLRRRLPREPRIVHAKTD